MWNQQISKSLGNLFVEHLTAENKRLSDHDKNLYKNVTIKDTINRKMPISGTFFTLFLLLSGLTFFALFGDAYVKTAIAMHEFNEPDSTPSLQENSDDRSGYSTISSSFGSQGDENSGSSTYENSDFGISMQVPAGWQDAPPEEVDGLIIQLQPNTRLATLTLIAYELERGISQEELNDVNRQWLTDTGFEVTGSGSINVAGGIPASYFEYESYEQGLKGTAVSVMGDDTEYLFDYYGPPGGYNEHLTDVERMVSSFEISQGGGQDAGSSDFGQGQDQGFGQNEGQGQDQGFGQNEGQGQDQGFGQNEDQGFGQNEDQGFGQNEDQGFRG